MLVGAPASPAWEVGVAPLSTLVGGVDESAAVVLAVEEGVGGCVGGAMGDG
ncbi:hypothetical protein HMPREF1979_00893, partial [Actinomyces johnsonii F0542]